MFRGRTQSNSVIAEARCRAFSTPSRLRGALARCALTSLLVGAAPSLGAAAETLDPATGRDPIEVPRSELASVESGLIQLKVQPEERKVEGVMILIGTRTESGILHATLPSGIQNLRTMVQCRELESRVEDGRLAIQVGTCPPQGCVVDISWTLDASHWNAADRTSWLGPDGYALSATDMMPRLALDRGLAERLSENAATAIGDSGTKRAPPAANATPDSNALGGNWRWVLRIDGMATGEPLRRGRIAAPSDFADAWVPKLARSPMGPQAMRLDRTPQVAPMR